MEFKPKLDHGAEAPLYRQLSEQIAQQIRSGVLAHGERLPATRELAGLLGLNRTTVSAAYEILESEGLISGQVGRGSFVTGGAETAGGVDWNGLLERNDASVSGPNGGWSKDVISFAVSRPSRDLFPLDEFRATCATVLARRDLADILQLGSPSGYEPLRRYLMEEARRQQLAGPADDLLITNGCQQALDLIGRVLLRPGDTVAVEDPLYTGLKNLLTGMGAQLCGIPVGADGMDAVQLERALEREKPRFLVVTSNFQNPTGVSLPLAAQESAARCGTQGERAGDRKRRLWRAALQRRAAARAEATGRRRRNRAAAQLLQSQLPGIARGLGGGAEAADRPAAACQGSGGFAHGSAFAGGAAGVRRIGPPGGASHAHAPGGQRATGGHAGGMRQVPARGHALDASGRRHECLGPAARTAGCGRVAGAGAARRRGIHAGAILRGFAAGAGSAAIEFCRADAGADPRRGWRFWDERLGPSWRIRCGITSLRPRWSKGYQKEEERLCFSFRASSFD